MRNLLTPKLIAAFLICFLAFTALSVDATSMKHRNIVELISLSDLILVGQVTSVTDGIDGGVPYTEITIIVSESLRGDVGSVYTFRQFGLLAPRDMGNGRTYVGLSPDGWPRFATGENVMLFLYTKSDMTGLRTTVGLLQGKFTERRGRFVNGIDNRGLFRNVSVAQGVLDPAEEKLLEMRKGSVATDILVSFVRKAVQRRLVEDGKLEHVK
jgi:hypothetical protein